MKTIRNSAGEQNIFKGNLSGFRAWLTLLHPELIYDANDYNSNLTNWVNSQIGVVFCRTDIVIMVSLWPRGLELINEFNSLMEDSSVNQEDEAESSDMETKREEE